MTDLQSRIYYNRESKRGLTLHAGAGSTVRGRRRAARNVGLVYILNIFLEAYIFFPRSVSVPQQTRTDLRTLRSIPAPPRPSLISPIASAPH